AFIAGVRTPGQQLTEKCLGEDIACGRESAQGGLIRAVIKLCLRSVRKSVRLEPVDVIHGGRTPMRIHCKMVALVAVGRLGVFAVRCYRRGCADVSCMLAWRSRCRLIALYLDGLNRR